MSPDPDRREFLAVCGVLAASLAACTGVGRGMRAASSFIADPGLADYGATLRALIETLLPIGSGEFPLDVNTVEQRLLRMFPLDDERRFLGLQRTLVYFDALDLAPHVAAPLLAAERIALDVPSRLSEAEFRSIVAAKSQTEWQSCETFFHRFGRPARFAALAPEARLSWLRLWGASEFAVKRDFARTIRTLIYMSAYSSERVWPVIGYDGPLLKLPERMT